MAGVPVIIHAGKGGNHRNHQIWRNILRWRNTAICAACFCLKITGCLQYGCLHMRDLRVGGGNLLPEIHISWIPVYRNKWVSALALEDVVSIQLSSIREMTRI